MPIFANELRHGWKSLLWWALGLVLVTLMYVPFYESIGQAPKWPRSWSRCRRR